MIRFKKIRNDLCATLVGSAILLQMAYGQNLESEPVPEPEAETDSAPSLESESSENKDTDYLSLLSEISLSPENVLIARLDNSQPDNQQLAEFFSAYAKTDPEKSGRLAEMLSSGFSSDKDPSTEAWSEEEIRSGLQKMFTLPDSSRRTKSLSTLSQLLVSFSPTEAITSAQHISAVSERRDLTLDVAAEWASKDPQAANAWLKQSAQGELKNELQVRFAALWAQDEPAVAAEYVVGLDPGAGKNQAIRLVADRWAAVEPLEAAEWILSFSESKLRDELLRNALTRWRIEDPESAKKWQTNLDQETESKIDLLFSKDISQD